MLEAAAWGLVAGSFLVVGALIGLLSRVSRQYVALVMAFGAGALTSALAFDLTAEAFAGGGTATTAAGLVAGALAFVAGDVLLQRREPRRRRRAAAGRPRTVQTGGRTIVLGALLDGVPESVVLGSTLLGGVGVSVSLLAALAASNLPEGIAGARDLLDEGHSRGRIIGLWAVVALASSVAAGIGFGLMGGMSTTPVALVQAFAAGAILAMLADTMFPEALAFGGEAVGLATVLGFAAAFFLSRA